MKVEVIIIDYGAGNPSSIKNIIKKIGYNASITKTITDIKNATHIILPGVGHFKFGMESLKSTNIIRALEKKVFDEQTPLLGICLGMQLLTEFSEEGNIKGLNWIKNTKTTSLKTSLKSSKVPHMGWNYIKPIDHPLFFGIENPRFYFVHSYKVETENDKNKLCTTNYEIPFTSGIYQDNIFGVQFHPEKSHKYGYKLLENFLNI